MYTPALIEYLAELIRSVEVNGQKVFPHVYAERDGRFIRFDIEGVMGELFFEAHETPDTPVGSDMYSIGHETLATAPVGLVDAIESPHGRSIAAVQVVSVALVPQEQVLHPEWRVVEIDGQAVE